jgi:hypothetical protein
MHGYQMIGVTYVKLAVILGFDISTEIVQLLFIFFFLRFIICMYLRDILLRSVPTGLKTVG